MAGYLKNSHDAAPATEEIKRLTATIIRAQSRFSVIRTWRISRTWCVGGCSVVGSGGPGSRNAGSWLFGGLGIEVYFQQD
jgi:hypothetical protein